ncbi:MAG: glycosyltransferase family 2 protein, partial [Planctomycetota bacterium]
VRRASREGFKAGALAHGLASVEGELVAILDADFVPAPDFLARAVPHFEDPRVGLVQARWEHTNRSASLLTRVQALLLDAHFLVEQAARSRSGRPFKFNGTGGVWRRAAIDDAGGWSADTLTEDLDLSVRAQLRGWRFVFLDDVVAAGELPEDLAAFRSQQRRWVKGSAETARKLLGAVWRTPGVPLGARIETTVQLLLNASYPLALVLALLTVPLVGLGVPRSAHTIGTLHAALFFLATANVGAFLVASQLRRGVRGVVEALLLLPFVFALGLGLSLSNARAFLSGLLGRASPFVRTPKRGTLARLPYAAAAPLGEALVELLVALYLGWGGALAITSHRPLALPFQAVLILGFLAVGMKTLTSGLKTKFPVTRSLT